MKTYYNFFHSKLARRFFLLFICCAILPIGIVSFLSFTHVVNQLDKQCQMKLHQAAKSVGMGIFERLMFLQAEMNIVSTYFIKKSDISPQTLTYAANEPLEKRIKDMDLFIEVSITDHIKKPPELTPAAMKHLKSGEPFLFVRNFSGRPSRVFMAMPVSSQNSEAKILIGEINNDYLWGIGPFQVWPPMTELCVLDQSKNILFSSLPLPLSFQNQIAFQKDVSTLRQYKWKDKDTTYLACSWDAFLKSQFHAPMWTIMLSQSETEIHNPIVYFKKTFLLIVLGFIFVVLFLSSILIRKRLVPLKKLQQGTLRIAAKNFDSRVNIASGDEFEDLGESFNSMAIQLGRQFNALETMAEVSQTILSTLDADRIKETIFKGMRNIFKCDVISVSLIDSHDDKRGITDIDKGIIEGNRHVETFQLSSGDFQKFDENPDYFLIDEGCELPPYLYPVARNGIKSFLVLPIFLKERLSGFIAIGFINPHSIFEEDHVQGRQLTDQVAVALSNSFLVEELNQLNWGTLTALARTVDAKSPWTAGHSERVTTLALKIGEAFDFSLKELETLRRGSLLHDVGKIGIPVSILDKPGKLTDEEYSTIKNHSALGARILEPIRAYSEIIPIVVQHHERFDGKGYPEGIAGEAISLGGRILAVCDVYDALVSDRPYRSGWEHERVMEIIEQESGKQFDPKIVEVFLEVMTEKKESENGTWILTSDTHSNSDIVKDEVPTGEPVINSGV